MTPSCPSSYFTSPSVPSRQRPSPSSGWRAHLLGRGKFHRGTPPLSVPPLVSRVLRRAGHLHRQRPGRVGVGHSHGVVFGRGHVRRGRGTGRGDSSSLLRGGAPLHGDALPTRGRRGAHLGQTVLAVCLHRHLFFGTASQVADVVNGFFAEQPRVVADRARHLKYLVFDFEQVDGVDSTALACFGEVVARAQLQRRRRAERADAAPAPQVLLERRCQATVRGPTASA